MRYVRTSEWALMWPIEALAAPSRPDPVGHVKWRR